MANKLIFKVEFDKQAKDTIKINSEIDSWRVYFNQCDKHYGMECVLIKAEEWAEAIVDATINSSL